ncbi:MAG TPA: hypothetical protein VGK32_00930 [Vicinamibacterales bacterium]|jgi:hypothetical protein
MSYAVIALTLVGLVEAGVLVFVLRGLRRLDQVESRLAHLTDALTLLAETAESGFRASASELGRIADRPELSPAAVSRTTTRRMTHAVKSGRPVTAIAADEKVSEGEVNLRVHLARSAAARGKTAARKREGTHAALRS